MLGINNNNGIKRGVVLIKFGHFASDKAARRIWRPEIGAASITRPRALLIGAKPKIEPVTVAPGGKIIEICDEAVARKKSAARPLKLGKNFAFIAIVGWRKCVSYNPSRGEKAGAGKC